MARVFEKVMKLVSHDYVFYTSLRCLLWRQAPVLETQYEPIMIENDADDFECEGR